jgi:hypothetical protein
MRTLAVLAAFLIGILALWFGYGEVKRLVRTLPQRLRDASQRAEYAFQLATLRAEGERLPIGRRLTVAAIATVIPGGHPRSHR